MTSAVQRFVTLTRRSISDGETPKSTAHFRFHEYHTKVTAEENLLVQLMIIYTYRCVQLFYTTCTLCTKGTQVHNVDGRTHSRVKLVGRKKT